MRQPASLLLLGIASAAATCLFGQATGTISGFVTDPSGAVVPGASVTATLIQQQVRRTVESNADGFYTLNAMPPGDYSLTVEKAGFQRLERSGIAVTVNQNLRVDVELRVGQAAETVSVSAEVPLVDTRSATISGLVDDRRVVDLPLNGRNVIALAVTLPGIVSVGAPQQLTDARSGPTMNVNGSLENMNLFTFNGGIFVNPSRNTGMNYPPPDAVKEFSIQAQNFSAEYGRNAGSQVNVVSKSGTNDFHGAAWEFLRNDALNARNFFAARVPARKQNQFGFAAGGPIRRNKLFIFGSYQGLLDRKEAVSIQSTVPSDAQRNGNFTDLGKTLRNPVNAITGEPFTDAGGAPCVANNVIRQGCISQMAKSLLPLIPQSPSGRVTVLSPSPQDGNMFLIRSDWNASARHTISGHAYFDRNTRDRPTLISGTVPNYLSDRLSEQTTMGALNDTYTFRPNLLNELHVTFLRPASLLKANKNIDPASIGVNMPLYAEAGGLSVNIGTSVAFGGGSGRVVFTNNNWQFRDVASWMRGRHSLKFGGEWLHLHFRQIFLGTPSFTFNGSRTGDEFADFMLGAFYQLSGGFGIRTNDNFEDAPSFFFQDEFRINSRFMLTYGVRWEPFFPWVDRYDRLESLAGITTRGQSTRFPTAPPGILFAGDPGVPRTISGPDKNNFAPRIGFAWDLFGNGRTSLRGAYGIFYDSIKADSVSQENAPWAGGFQVFNGLTADPFGSVGRTAPPVNPGESFGCVKISAFPGVRCDLYPLPLAGLYIDSHLRTPYIQSWNLTVQRQITPSILVQAAYVGKAATKIEGWRNFNPARFVNDPVTGAPPSLQNVNNRTVYLPGILAPNAIVVDNSFRSWYHSFQPQITKRFSRGISFSAAYTLSKSIDTLASNIYSRLLDNPFNLRDNRGRSDFDRRHVFVASWLWSPSWRFANPFGKVLLNGWTLTGIHMLQSGAPFTVRMGADVALDGSGSRQHAMLKPGAGPVARDHANRADMVAKFFNTDAFLAPSAVPPGTYGNSGRNIISGPGFSTTNFSAIKEFAFTERYRTQFRAEFFNLFNQVMLGCNTTTGGCADPDNSASSRTFGQIRSAGAAREIQFALKFIW